MFQVQYSTVRVIETSNMPHFFDFKGEVISVEVQTTFFPREDCFFQSPEKANMDY